MSQLHIHYHESSFVYEITRGADNIFKKGPRAGYRAPDAPVDGSTLFSLLQSKPIHLLIFQEKKICDATVLEKLSALEANYTDWIQIHHFISSLTYTALFQRYGVTSSAIYIIRPDGYIGFRVYGVDLTLTDTYLKCLLQTN